MIPFAKTTSISLIVIALLTQPSWAEFIFRIGGEAASSADPEDDGTLPSVSYQPDAGPQSLSGTIVVGGSRAPFEMTWDTATVERIQQSAPVVWLDQTGRTLNVDVSDSCHGAMSLTRSGSDGTSWRYQATPGQGSTCAFPGPFPYRVTGSDGKSILEPGPTDWLLAEPNGPVEIANLRAVSSPDPTRENMHAYCFDVVSGAGNFIHFARTEVSLSVSYYDLDPDDGLDPTAENGGYRADRMAHFPRDIWLVPLSSFPRDASAYQAMKDAQSSGSRNSFPSTSRPFGAPEPASFGTTKEREMCVILENYDLEGLMEDSNLVVEPPEGAGIETVDIHDLKVHLATMSFDSENAPSPIHDSAESSDSRMTGAVVTDIRAFPIEEW